MNSFCLASEVKITGYLVPSGIFEITSKEIKGYSFYREKGIVGAKKIVVTIKSLKSGFALRDSHIYKFLKAKKYKNIVMKNIEIRERSGHGFITINGVEKKIGFSVENRNKDYLCRFKINWKEFNLDKISFMGVYPKDTVDVEVRFSKKSIY